MPTSSRIRSMSGRIARLELGVECGKRLVHQEEARAGQQRPPERHALLFAAREPRRTAIEQARGPEQVDHPRQRFAPLRRWRVALAIDQVLADGQMGKEASFLEDITDPAAMRRKEMPRRRVAPDLAGKGDAPARRPGEAGDQIDEGRLSRTGWPEERGQSRTDRQVGGQFEIPLGMTDIDLEHHAAPSRSASRRDTTSEATRAASDSPIEISVRRIAA